MMMRILPRGLLSSSNRLTLVSQTRVLSFSTSAEAQKTKEVKATKEAKPTTSETKKAPTKEQDLYKQPSLGVNKTYDEALKWFEGVKLKKQARLAVVAQKIDTLKADLTSLQQKDNAQDKNSIENQINVLKEKLKTEERNKESIEKWLWRTDPIREKKARLMMESVEIPCVSTLSNESYLSLGEGGRAKEMAKYWGIFDDVLQCTPFSPKINLVVKYKDDVVIRGNTIQPSKTYDIPTVKFEGDPSKTYTLALIDADEPCTKQKSLVESIHWIVTNITKSDITTGTTVFNYIPPHPQKGTNPHRFVFCLFEQDKKIDSLVTSPTIEQRKISTKTIMTENKLTPISYSFFRASWDSTVSKVYTEFLKHKEPVYAPKK